MELIKKFLVSKDLGIGPGQQRQEPALVTSVIHDGFFFTIWSWKLFALKRISDGNVQGKLLSVHDAAGERNSSLNQGAKLSKESSTGGFNDRGVNTVLAHVCVTV